MTDDEVGKDRIGRVTFMLFQLRDDIDEIVSGLESGEIGMETAVAGAKTQL